MKRVIVLGSTGSIGVQALEVLSARPGIEVVGLSCGSNSDVLFAQAATLGCTELAVENEAIAEEASRREIFSIRRGRGAAAQLVRDVEADLVLNAIVGFAGLEATLACVESGATLALANKESLVCAGTLVRRLSELNGVSILPVDSEHSALFQLIEAVGIEAVDSVVITGSGGPFRGWGRDALVGVSREQALNHPTWSMGAKISIDSATLMNKGLEVIEAHHLFGLAYDRINVVVHPQSIVHAFVRMVDGALLAHLGMPDMKVPIAYSLDYPGRGPVETPRLALEDGVSLDFGCPDEETFPAIRLAREAGARGDRCTCALNAANEVAVHSFLGGSLGFMGVVDVVAEVLGAAEPGDVGTYDEAEAVDSWARDLAQKACAKRAM